MACESLVFMVPGAGTTSNSQSGLIAEWNRNNKGVSKELEAALPPETSQQLFETLAQWNEFLNNHAPYFSDAQEPQEPGS